MNLTIEEITARLQPITAALAADGYELSVTGPEAGRLTAQVRATPEACADCLVPKQVMGALLAQAIGTGGPTAEEIDLVYPAEPH
jgi:hypothetical protein